MPKEKRSFFERLTGSISMDESESTEEETKKEHSGGKNVAKKDSGWKPEDLDLSITRDMVTVKGALEESREISEGDYFTKELYLGRFSRTILLPQEIDVDGAEATEKHGLLIIKLPKLDKSRQAKVKVKSN